MSPTAQNFLRVAACGFERNSPKVCCPDEGNPDDRVVQSGGNPNQDGSKEVDDDPDQPFQNPLLLLPNKCGEDYGNRIIGGERTELDEFPWMAVLVYETREYFQRVGIGNEHYWQEAWFHKY